MLMTIKWLTLEGEFSISSNYKSLVSMHYYPTHPYFIQNRDRHYHTVRNIRLRFTSKYLFSKQISRGFASSSQNIPMILHQNVICVKGQDWSSRQKAGVYVKMMSAEKFKCLLFTLFFKKNAPWTGIARLVHVFVLNLTTQILIFPCWMMFEWWQTFRKSLWLSESGKWSEKCGFFWRGVYNV